jgi:ligand-binding sensor domain-containing protein/signal transduction histidine kinase
MGGWYVAHGLDSNASLREVRCQRFRSTGCALRSALAALLLLATTALHCVANASSLGGVERARIEPMIVKLPVTDGNDLRFTRLSVSQGLTQTRVAQIVQDDQGFLWFGTQNGLNRFDGYKFRGFTHEPDRRDSLGGVFVYSLFKDRSGAIWVGTDQSLDRYDSATESFTHFRVDPRNPIVTHISQDRDGLLWLATGRGLFRLDTNSGASTRFAHNPGDAFSLPSDDVKFSGEDRAGGFWVATSKGLVAFDRATGKVTFHVPLNESVREFSFHEDRSGVFWIAYGSGNGLATLDRQTQTLTKYSFREQEGSGTALTGVFAMLEDRAGEMWFATMGAGLLRFDRNTRSMTRYQNQPGDPESLAENRVIALFEDREGNIWSGLHAMAPNFARGRSPFQKFEPRTAGPDSMGENLVNAIYQDRAGQLWMGAGGALNRVDRSTAQYRRYRPGGAGTHTDVLTMLEDTAGDFWIGTLGNGLGRFDRNTGTFTLFRHDAADPRSISHNIITRLFVDRAGALWAASWDGLNRFDPRTASATVYRRVPGGPAEPYFSMAEDNEGNLWLGSTSGLYRFDPRTGQFTEFKHRADQPGTLSNDTINAVFVDQAGTLWLGTQNGLNRFDRRTGTFSVFYRTDGLPGNAVSCILEDERHELWISTNNGISRFNPATASFRNYSVSDGLPGADLTAWGACFKGASGDMFFGGFAGAVAFHPDKVRDSSYVPPVVLTDFKLSGKTVAPGGGSLLTRSITHADPLTLSHQENSFAVEFSALSFSGPETNRYRYRLDGLDTAWHEVGSAHRLAAFTTLPAGAYVLRVQGASSRGPWSEPGTQLEITVLPAWWHRGWFRALCAATLLLVVLALYALRARQIAWRFETQLEARVNERIRIARELHDSLLQGFQGLMFRLEGVRQLLPARTTEALQSLERALVLGDQAVTEAREAVQDLRSSSRIDSDLVRALTALCETLVRDLAGPDLPAWRVIESGKAQALSPLVRDEAYFIAREAMRNAYRHAAARQIEIDVTFGPSTFSLHVRDDGVGIGPDVIASGARAGHWGLSGMRERAAALGGHLEVWSKEGAGTEVALTIPASVAYRRVSAFR